MKVNLPINKVVTGDCREVMAEWPEDCIDFVMFSPPYWSLRDYGEEVASIWGDDGDCKHEWGSEEAYHDNLRFKDPNEKANVGTDKDPEVYSEPDREQAFCWKCGAWRGQLGLEPDYRLYVKNLVEVGKAIRQILKPSGSWWLNLGDTYSSRHTGGHKSEKSTVGANKEGIQEIRQPPAPSDIPNKCQMAMPERVMLALIDDGWIRRNAAIWHKPNPMPSSVKDRLNTTYEFVYHFVQRQKYYYDLDAIREPHKLESVERDKYAYNTAMRGRSQMPDERREDVTPKGRALNPKGKNPGDVFEITTKPFPEAHFAVYPPELCELPIKSSCPSKVCVECGEPYTRKTEKRTTFHSGSGKAGNPPDGKYGKDWEQAKSGSYDIRMGPKTSVEFKGWRKNCDCSTDETKTGIVLDPMCGAGSTLKMAEKLGRRYIGIEISPEYADMARRRVKSSLNQTVPKKVEEPPEMIPKLEVFDGGR